MMTVALTALVAVALWFLWVAINWAIDRPERGTLADVVENGLLTALARLGGPGAYVFFRSPNGGTVTFVRQGEDPWHLEIEILGHKVTSNLLNDVRRGLEILSFDLECDAMQSQHPGGCRFAVRGPRLRSADSVPKLAQLVFSSLGHSEDERYAYAFEGPRDDIAVQQLFDELLGRDARDTD